jgi:glycosyltransferase involved in cell wall biosynthesis
MSRAEIIAIDAGPARGEATGVGVYVRELATRLRSLAPDRVRLIGARPDGPLAAVAATRMRGARHLVWVQRHAARDARSVGAELAHFTNAIAPLRPGVPFVLTIQDLSLIRYPHYHPALRLLGVPFMAISARRAARVIVPSAATADEVHRLLRVPHDRIERIELAPPPARTAGDLGSAAATLERYGLAAERYVLTIATLEPRKNVARLVRAFEAVASRQPDLRLVLVGGRGWRTASIQRAIARSPARDRIVVTGFVTDDDRAALLTGCGLFVYVSLYEGYGLPIVEAMQAGAPVVTSAVSSMPEAAGGAAVLVDPSDPKAIAEGMLDALRRRAELIDAGHRRVAHLSWDRVARETLAVYDVALRAG